MLWIRSSDKQLAYHTRNIERSMLFTFKVAINIEYFAHIDEAANLLFKLKKYASRAPSVIPVTPIPFSCPANKLFELFCEGILRL
jgi:hypothetical protein